MRHTGLLRRTRTGHAFTPAGCLRAWTFPEMPSRTSALSSAASRGFPRSPEPLSPTSPPTAARSRTGTPPSRSSVALSAPKETALKDTAPKNKVEAALSAGSQFVEVQAPAPVVGLPPVSLDKAQELRNLPVATRNAVTTGLIADLKKSAAPPDARALFYGTLFAGGGGGGRGGAVGGIASGAAGIRPLAKTATAAPAGHLGIQYRILRKTDSGE